MTIVVVSSIIWFAPLKISPWNGGLMGRLLRMYISTKEKNYFFKSHTFNTLSTITFSFLIFFLFIYIYISHNIIHRWQGAGFLLFSDWFFALRYKGFTGFHLTVLVFCWFMLLDLPCFLSVFVYPCQAH